MLGHGVHLTVYVKSTLPFNVVQSKTRTCIWLYFIHSVVREKQSNGSAGAAETNSCTMRIVLLFYSELYEKCVQWSKLCSIANTVVQYLAKINLCFKSLLEQSAISTGHITHHSSGQIKQRSQINTVRPPVSRCRKCWVSAPPITHRLTVTSSQNLRRSLPTQKAGN